MVDCNSFTLTKFSASIVFLNSSNLEAYTLSFPESIIASKYDESTSANSFKSIRSPFSASSANSNNVFSLTITFIFFILLTSFS